MTRQYLLQSPFVCGTIFAICCPAKHWKGPNIMRVVVNEALISRNRTIAQILFFVSLAGMGIGFFYSWTADTASSSQISCIILPILLFLTLTSVRLANNWIREPRPIDVLHEALKGLGKKYTIFHHLLPAPHVLVGPEGVFTITTMWHEGQYKVAGKKWHGEGGLGRRLMGFMRQDLLGNPFQDAMFHAQQMQRLIDKVAPDSDIEVQPLIVFINPKAKVEIEDPIIPVLYADSKKKPSLRHYLRTQEADPRNTLSQEQLDEIDGLYGLVTRQELAEAEGYTVADEDKDAVAMIEDEVSEAGEKAPQVKPGEQGTIYIFKAGQLYRIGIVEDSLDAERDRIQDEAGEIIEVIHTFKPDDPEATLEKLRDKYARKRQKKIWFGLSKKDVEWLQTLEGDLE